MSRGDLTDAQWRILDPILPDGGERSPEIEDKRRTVDGFYGCCAPAPLTAVEDVDYRAARGLDRTLFQMYELYYILISNLYLDDTLRGGPAQSR